LEEYNSEAFGFSRAADFTKQLIVNILIYHKQAFTPNHFETRKLLSVGQVRTTGQDGYTSIQIHKGFVSWCDGNVWFGDGWCWVHLMFGYFFVVEVMASGFSMANRSCLI